MNEQLAQKMGRGGLKPRDPAMVFGVVVDAFQFTGMDTTESEDADAGKSDKPSNIDEKNSKGGGAKTKPSVKRKPSAGALKPDPWIYLVRMTGSKQDILITSPRVADRILDGPVFAGGLMAGEMHGSVGLSTIVLQNGFLIGADQLKVGPKNETRKPARK